MSFHDLETAIKKNEEGIVINIPVSWLVSGFKWAKEKARVWAFYMRRRKRRKLPG
jgi:hypothetical protein